MFYFACNHGSWKTNKKVFAAKKFYNSRKTGFRPCLHVKQNTEIFAELWQTFFWNFTSKHGFIRRRGWSAGWESSRSCMTSSRTSATSAWVWSRRAVRRRPRSKRNSRSSTTKLRYYERPSLRKRSMLYAAMWLDFIMVVMVVVIHCVSKTNISDVFSYNSRKHWRIFIIFGRNVAEKASNHMLLYFSTSPN